MFVARKIKQKLRHKFIEFFPTVSASILFTPKIFMLGKNFPTDVLVKHRVFLNMVSDEDGVRNWPWVLSFMLDLNQAGCGLGC